MYSWFDLCRRFAGQVFQRLEKFQESPDEMVRLKDRKALEDAADLLKAASLLLSDLVLLRIYADIKKPVYPAFLITEQQERRKG